MVPAPTLRKAVNTSDVEIEQYIDPELTSTEERTKTKQAARIATKKAELTKHSARDIYKYEQKNNNITTDLLLKLAKQAGNEGDLEFMFKMMKTVDAKINGTFQHKKSIFFTITKRFFKGINRRRSKSLDLSGDQYSNEIGEQLRELQVAHDEEKKRLKQFRKETDQVFDMFYNPTPQSQRMIKDMLRHEKEAKAQRKAESKQVKKQAADVFDMFYNPTTETRQMIKDMMRAEKEAKAKNKAEAKSIKKQASDVFEMFYNPTPETQQMIKDMMKKEKEAKAKAKAEARAAKGGQSRRPSFFSNLKSELSNTTKALDLATTSKRPSTTRASTFPTIQSFNESKGHIPHLRKRNIYRGTNAQTADQYDYSPLISRDFEEDDLDLYGAPVVQPVSYLDRNAPMTAPILPSTSKNPFESSLI